MTRYKVLRKHDAPKAETNGTSSVRVLGGYEIIGTYDAHTAKAAIQQAVLAMTDAQRKEADGATFAATPDGSWTELTVGVAVETKVTVA